MNIQSSTIVQRVWNYCNVLRDDGISYGDYVEQLTYLRILKELGSGSGLIPTIFRKAQNKIQDPAKLKRLITLINGETWVRLDIDTKGEIYEGLLEKNAQEPRAAPDNTSPRAR
jgi:type I restriction enzyme M protein